MDWWTEVRLLTEAFLDRNGILAAFVFLLVEEAGLPIPIPGDFLMLVLGVQARQGKVQLWEAILFMELATVLGASFLYFLAAWAGRSLVYRYGRFMRLSPERLDAAGERLKRHGFTAVFLGRLLPGFRIVTAVACGVFGVPFRVYFPAMALGGLGYIAMYTLLGYFVGTPVLAFLERLHLPLGLLGSLIPLTILLIWVFRARRELRPGGSMPSGVWEIDQRHHLRSGAEAGLLATMGSTLVMNLLLNLAGNLAFNAPGTIVEQTAARLASGLARDVGPLVLILAVPAYVAVGVLWGAVFGAQHQHLPDLPDAGKGLIFSMIPLAISLLIVMPLLGLGVLGVGGTGPVAAVGETLRHAAYGALLGLVYPVLLARRRQRGTPSTGRREAPPDLS